MKVFVSHHKEEPLARRLKEIINRLLPGHFDVVVAPHDVALGSQWLAELRAQLRQSGLLLALCGQAVSHHPWIWFESGAVFMKNANAVIPVCYAGQTKEQLPAPFSHLQALDLMKPEGFHRLIRRLAAEANEPVPAYDFEQEQGVLAASVAPANSLSEILRKAGLEPDTACARHIERLPYRPSGSIGGIDGALLLWHSPEFHPFGPELIDITGRDEAQFPEVFTRFPGILRLPVDDIPRGRNRPKWFISQITYPGTDLTMRRLRLGLGHSSYRRNMQLQRAMDRPVDERGRTLRSVYETEELDYLHDLPNMVIVKPVLIASATTECSEQILFVRRPSRQQTDYYPGTWTVGIDEQMQGKPLTIEEAGYQDPEFEPDLDFFAATRRGILEELGIPASLVQLDGVVAIFREYENYNVNVLMLCHVRVAPDDLPSYLVRAVDQHEGRLFEWRSATIEELGTVLGRPYYVPQNGMQPSGPWHPDSRLRLLLTCFSLFGYDETLQHLKATVESRR